MSDNIKEKQEIDVCLEHIQNIRDNTNIFSGLLNGLLANDNQLATVDGFNRLIKQNREAALFLKKHVLYMDTTYGDNEIETYIDEEKIFADIAHEKITIKVVNGDVFEESTLPKQVLNKNE